MWIRWTVPAADDLENIKNYLQRHYPHFAEPTVRTIYLRIRSLKTAPHQGRPGHRSGTRELPLTPLPLCGRLCGDARGCRNPAHSSRGTGLALRAVPLLETFSPPVWSN